MGNIKREQFEASKYDFCSLLEHSFPPAILVKFVFWNVVVPMSGVSQKMARAITQRCILKISENLHLP